MLRSSVLAASLLAFAVAAAAADSDWLDIESRIQYGFYTEDARALSNLVQQLTDKASTTNALQSYYTALASYRLAQLTAQRDKAEARRNLNRCIESLERALRAHADPAEPLALQSACLQSLAAVAPWRAPLAAGKRSDQLERALHLAPKNPRVLLIDALTEEDAAQTLLELKKAVAAFEAERQGVDQIPGWGAAEAYVYLGRAYLQNGDAVAARDALERALLIAPDFALARRLMAKITTG